MNQFSFGNAISHWSNTSGPSGFVWKYALCYGVAAVLLAGVGIAIGGSIALTGGVNEFGQIDTNAIPQIIAYYAWSLFGGILIWAVFEAAAQRRYQHGVGFSLKFGGDELRLLVVGLLWLITVLVLYFIGAVVAGGITFAAMSASPELGLIIGVIATLAAVAFGVFIVVRLSPAGAMTIRDRKITFPSAWKATKGRFWPIFGAYFVMFLIAFAVILVVYFVIIVGVVGLIFASGGAENMADDPEAAFGALLSPVGLIVGLILGVGVYSLLGLIQFAFQGIPGLVAKTDPTWSGAGSRVDDAFS